MVYTLNTYNLNLSITPQKSWKKNVLNFEKQFEFK